MVKESCIYFTGRLRVLCARFVSRTHLSRRRDVNTLLDTPFPRRAIARERRSDSYDAIKQSPPPPPPPPPPSELFPELLTSRLAAAAAAAAADGGGNRLSDRPSDTAITTRLTLFTLEMLRRFRLSERLRPILDTPAAFHKNVILFFVE